MMRKKNKQKDRSLRCVLSRRQLNSSNAVHVSSAVDYVKKLGFTVLPILFFLIPFVSAESFLVVDFTKNYNILFIAGLILFGIVLLFTNFFLIGSGLLAISGFIMLFSGINEVISSVFIFLGLLTIFMVGRLRAK